MSNDTSRHRLGLIAVTAVSLFGALLARLWTLQVVETAELQVEAAGQSTREVVIPAPRGRILDRNGIVLVGNRPSVVLGIDLQVYGEMEEQEQDDLRERLAEALNFGRAGQELVTAKQIQTRLNNDRFSRWRPIPVADDLAAADAIYFEEQAARFPSVVVERTTVRDYPYGSLAAHVLGYVGPLSDAQWNGTDDEPGLEEENLRDKPYTRSDDIGKSGVEASYERYLRGTPGRRVYEVDRNNNVIGELTDQRVEPEPGDDLYLSLDARVQAETEVALRTTIRDRRATPGELGYYPADGGAAVVIDPRNGQVRSMASYPTYDPRDLVGGISQETWEFLNDEENGLPLNNRAIAGAYPPASTFKLATAYAAMKLNLTTPREPFYDPGTYTVPGCTGSTCVFSSPSAEYGGGQTVDLQSALTVSSDVYFYRLGNDSWAIRDRVGETAFQDLIRELGFGERTGIELTGESAGRVPDPEWLKEFDVAVNGEATEAGQWRVGASINMAIGQGNMLATPLQLANAYAAFANDGTLYRPSLLERIVPQGSEEPSVTFAPEVLGALDWGTDAHQAMEAGFEGVVAPGQGGTARAAFDGFPLSSWPVAGKTGTAETGTDRKPEEDNSMFVGYGPATAPEYTAAVAIEHAGSGGSAAAPTVRDIFEVIAADGLDEVDLAAVADPASFGDEGTGADHDGDGIADTGQDADGDGVLDPLDPGSAAGVDEDSESNSSGGSGGTGAAGTGTASTGGSSSGGSGTGGTAGGSTGNGGSGGNGARDEDDD